jgi:hypothetical protein
LRGNSEGSINQYLADTIANVFSTVYTVDVTGSTNRELFASNNENIIDTFTENKRLLNSSKAATYLYGKLNNK